MSKSGRSTRQSQYEINESELVKFVKHHPLLHDPNAEANDGVVEALWDEIAEKLCAPVDAVKLKWLNIKESYARRNSLRSMYNLSFLPLPSLDLSNDNSCASSNCSSPKEDGKRSIRSGSRQSMASESERSNSALPVHSAPRSKQNEPRTRTRMSTPGQKSIIAINKTQPKESNAQETLQSDVRGLANATGGKTQVKKQNVTDSTRAFFESMAMTVSTFPQHIQATLKIRICNLIGDAEYGLTIPKPC
ncbi:uncharacterized protein LOC143368158 [Andrena cerasifolii]|uniref:uncharacterized protein LOC143368158 n=1 Tax=Andrena cerasifolii TaxID=2819439 RepID=UPI0040379BEB